MAKDMRLVYLLCIKDDEYHEAYYIQDDDADGCGRPRGVGYIAARAPAETVAKWLQAQQQFEDVCTEIMEYVAERATPDADGFSVPWRYDLPY